MKKRAAALMCLFVITVSAFALDVRPEFRNDLRIGVSTTSRVDNINSFFLFSDRFIGFRTSVKNLDVGLGASVGRAESFYNFKTFTGSGDFRMAGVHVLLGLEYRNLKLDVCAGLCALVRSSAALGFRTLVRMEVCPVLSSLEFSKLGICVGLPVSFAFNASESVLCAGISIRTYFMKEEGR